MQYESWPTRPLGWVVGWWKACYYAKALDTVFRNCPTVSITVKNNQSNLYYDQIQINKQCNTKGSRAFWSSPGEGLLWELWSPTIQRGGGGKRRGKQYASLPDRCISHCQARLPQEHHSCEEFLMVERRASDHATLSPLHLGSRWG